MIDTTNIETLPSVMTQLVAAQAGTQGGHGSILSPVMGGSAPDFLTSAISINEVDCE